MHRIFFTLSLFSSLLLMVAMGLGLWIDDPAARNAAVQSVVAQHLLFSLGGLILALMVHGLVLTYFMGTGRWMEETTTSYGLDEKWRKENTTLKYRTLPWMIGSVFLLIAAGAFGAAADPASAVGFQGALGLTPANWHFFAAMSALGMHLVASFLEYFAIVRNGELIIEMMKDVGRVRAEHQSPDDSPASVGRKPHDSASDD